MPALRTGTVDLSSYVLLATETGAESGSSDVLRGSGLSLGILEARDYQAFTHSGVVVGSLRTGTVDLSGYVLLASESGSESGSSDVLTGSGLSLGILEARDYIAPSSTSDGELLPPSLESATAGGPASITSSDELPAPSIEQPTDLGAPSLTAYLSAPSVETATANDAATIASPGLLPPSIEQEVSLTTPGIGDAAGLIFSGVSATSAVALGAPRLTGTSLQVPSVESEVTLGEPILQKIAPPSAESATALGAPSLAAPMLVAMSALAIPDLGLPSIVQSDAAYQLFVNDIDRSDYWLLEGGLSISLSTGGRSSMRFTWVDTANATRPSIGHEVVFVFNGERLFGGIIEDLEEHGPTGSNSTIMVDVVCNGFASILDRRVVYGYWDGDSAPAYPAFIADAIRVRFLMTDGFYSISSGLAVAADLGTLFLQPMSAREAYDRIAGATNVDYVVDNYRTIRWIDPATGTGAAPVSITQSSNAKRLVADSVRVRTLAGLYRNKTYVPLSRSGSSTFTEKARPLLATSGNTTFYTTFPVISTPTVKITGVSGVVEEAVVMKNPGLPSEGWDCFWQQDEAFITLNPDGEYLTTTGLVTRVDVTYLIMDGLTSFATAENSTQITARQAIEGGSGLWESVENSTDVETIEEAEAIAQALNERYADSGVPQEVTFQSFVDGWQPGQLVALDLDRPAASGNFLVTDVTIDEHQGSLRAATPFLKYTVKCSSAGTLRRNTQNLRQNRQRSIDGITFTLARTITGGTNSGMAVGSAVAGVHTVTQGGLYADAHLYFDTPPTGADLILSVMYLQVGTSSWTELAEMTYPAASTSVIVEPINVRARRGDKLRVDVTQVGSTEPGKEGVLRVRVLQ